MAEPAPARQRKPQPAKRSPLRQPKPPVLTDEDIRLQKALQRREALPPLENQPPEAQYSLWGVGNMKPSDHVEIATLAWRQYQDHKFGGHSEDCSGEPCQPQQDAEAVLRRLWVMDRPRSPDAPSPDWEALHQADTEAGERRADKDPLDWALNFK